MRWVENTLMSWKKNLLCLHFQQKLSVFLDLGLNFWPKPHLSRWVSLWISALTDLKLGLMMEEESRHTARHG